MESDECLHIVENLHQLVGDTVVTSLLLCRLLGRKLLSSEDVQIIEAKPTAIAKSFELYTIIQTRTGAYVPLVEALLESGQTGVAATLSQILPSPVQMNISGGIAAKRASNQEIDSGGNLKRSKNHFEPKSFLFDVLPPSDLFTGRADELTTLHEAIIGDEDVSGSERVVTIISQVTSVGGLGGIGKTELARQYLHLHSNSFDYVIWVLAESLESATGSLRRLCTDKLDIPTKNSNGEEKSIKSLLEDVLQHVQGFKVLLVLDNAEKEEHVTTFIQAVRSLKGERRGVDVNGMMIHILITSRNTDWGTKQAINLREMSLSDAISFVKKGLLLEEEEEEEDGAGVDTENLVITLQCFPLAIQQAISYIKNEDKKRNYGIPDYLKDFNIKATKLLKAPVSPHEHLVDYTRTTYTTWEMTLEKIASLEEEGGQLALRILNIMAYLQADNIPRSMFLSLREGEGEEDGDEEEEEVEELVTSAVNILVKYSMIYGEERQSMLRLHRLVQHVTRLRLGNRSEQEVSVLRDALGVTSEGLNIGTVGHSISAWTHAVKYPQLVSLHSDIPRKVVQCFNSHFRYADSHKFGISAEAALASVLGNDESEVIHCLNCVIIDALIRNGEYDQAIRMVDEKLSTTTTTRDDKTTLELLDLKLRKGAALGFLTKHDEGIPLLKEAIEGRRRILGPDHKSTQLALFAATMVSVDLGRFEDALDLSEVNSALLKFQPSDNDDWYYFFQAQGAVGAYYVSVGWYAKARVALERLYGSRLENPLFAKHPQVIHAGCNLAVLLNRLGEHQQALQICEEVKALQESVLGKNHRGVLLAKQVIGVCLNRLGRDSEALAIQQEIYERLVSVEQYGEGNGWTQVCKLNLGISCSGLGRHEEGLGMMEEAVARLEGILSDSHDEVFQAKLQLAQAYARAGKVGEARNLLEVVHHNILDRYGVGHEDLPKINRILLMLHS